MSLEALASAVVESTARRHDEFFAAMPFRHVVIDEFFTPTLACELREQFPAADESLSRNRYGAAGLKAYRRDLTALGPAFQAADALFRSAAFLDWLTQVTGIPQLLYDETNFGGGTHENFDGRDLRPHVDFNIHPVSGLHRRLNVIVYLNEDWRDEWGGAIALHSDPRDPLDTIVEYSPSFNRCIIFETNERSWHGFERIRLPEGERHRSRKSLSIYFYTRERPQDELHREHTTFFVPRPLPPRFAGGYALSDEDANELGELIGQRDRLIELYQSELGKKNRSGPSD
ncbi:MAG TPA: 2OG-Fe(II) oxygenase [Candidatus Baltobacteraceae bacterium]|nr:2OG-Fe(II) oxygenase [Candidatus Baltobacteraceae bacterium]